MKWTHTSNYGEDPLPRMTNPLMVFHAVSVAMAHPAVTVFMGVAVRMGMTCGCVHMSVASRQSDRTRNKGSTDDEIPEHLKPPWQNALHPSC